LLKSARHDRHVQRTYQFLQHKRGGDPYFAGSPVSAPDGMKKFINSPKHVVQELLEGYTLAYHQYVQLTANQLVVRTTPKDRGKVGVVALASSGHEPGICGFVGAGMLDVAVPGEIFAAPGPSGCLDALRLAERGAGVVLIVLNHTSDLLTANITMEQAHRLNLNVKLIVVHEDVSIAPRSKPEMRRGLVGCLFMYKIIGAAAEAGLNIETIVTLAERLGQRIGTIAVATRPATHPATGKAMFALSEGQVELGMGIHGEPGTGKITFATADDLTENMVLKLLADENATAGDRVIIIVNGAGATSLMELFIIYRKVHEVLLKHEIIIADCRIGEYITTQEQAGFSICMAQVDEELLGFWKAPCHTPYFTEHA